MSSRFKGQPRDGHYRSLCLPPGLSRSARQTSAIVIIGFANYFEAFCYGCVNQNISGATLKLGCVITALALRIYLYYAY